MWIEKYGKGMKKTDCIKKGCSAIAEFQSGNKLESRTFQTTNHVPGTSRATYHRNFQG